MIEYLPTPRELKTFRRQLSAFDGGDMLRLRTLLMMGMGPDFSSHLVQVELPESIRGRLPVQQEEMLRIVVGVFSRRIQPVERWPLSPTVALSPEAPVFTPFVKAALPSNVHCWWLPLSICELIEKPRFLPVVLHGDGLLRENLSANWQALYERLEPDPNWFRLIPDWQHALCRAVRQPAAAAVTIYQARFPDDMPCPEIYIERIQIDFQRPALARAGTLPAPTVVVDLRRGEHLLPYEVPLTGHQIASLALMLARCRLTDGLEELKRAARPSKKELSSRDEARNAAEHICKRLLTNRHLPLRPRLYGDYVLRGDRLRIEPERVMEELTQSLECVDRTFLRSYCRHADELAQEHRAIEQESALSR